MITWAPNATTDSPPTTSTTTAAKIAAVAVAEAVKSAVRLESLSLNINDANNNHSHHNNSTTTATEDAASASSTTINGRRSVAEIVVWSVFLSLILLTAVLGNLLVIACVRTTARLREEKSNMFLVNLSITDVGSACVVMTSSLHALAADRWHLGKVWCDLVCGANYMFIIVSMLTLCFISLDRYAAVVHALRYKAYITRRKISLLLAWAWFQGVCFGLAPVAADWVRYDYWEVVCAIVWHEDSTNTLAYVIVAFAVCFLMPGVVLAVAYCKIIKVAKAQNNVHPHSTAPRPAPLAPAQFDLATREGQPQGVSHDGGRPGHGPTGEVATTTSAPEGGPRKEPSENGEALHCKCAELDPHKANLKTILNKSPSFQGYLNGWQRASVASLKVNYSPFKIEQYASSISNGGVENNKTQSGKPESNSEDNACQLVADDTISEKQLDVIGGKAGYPDMPNNVKPCPARRSLSAHGSPESRRRWGFRRRTMTTRQHSDSVDQYSSPLERVSSPSLSEADGYCHRCHDGDRFAPLQNASPWFDGQGRAGTAESPDFSRAAEGGMSPTTDSHNSHIRSVTRARAGQEDDDGDIWEGDISGAQTVTPDLPGVSAALSGPSSPAHTPPPPSTYDTPVPPESTSKPSALSAPSSNGFKCSSSSHPAHAHHELIGSSLRPVSSSPCQFTELPRRSPEGNEEDAVRAPAIPAADTTIGDRGKRPNGFPDAASHQAAKQRNYSASSKAVKSLLIVVLAYFICMTPFSITKLYKVIFPKPDALPGYINLVATMFQYCSSVINPLIYGIFRKDFQKAFLLIFKRTLVKLRLRDPLTCSMESILTSY